MPPSVPRRILPDKNVDEETDVERHLLPTPESNTGQSCGEQWCYIGIWHFHGDPKEPGIKGLGSLTNNFCPANFEKIILQRASKCFNDYKI